MHISRFISSIGVFLALTIIVSSVSAKTTEEAFTELLAQHQGKVVYLDFWASWCGPCRKSFPWLNDIKQRYAKHGLVVLSVNVDNNESFAIEFLKETPADFAIFYDPKGKIARQYQIKGMPSSFIIDKKGDVVSNHVGFTAAKKIKYEAELKLLLGL